MDQDLFDKNDEDFGNTEVKHNNYLIDNRQFIQGYIRTSQAMYDAVKSHLQQLLSNGIIRSSYASI